MSKKAMDLKQLENIILESGLVDEELRPKFLEVFGDLQRELQTSNELEKELKEHLVNESRAWSSRADCRRMDADKVLFNTALAGIGLQLTMLRFVDYPGAVVLVSHLISVVCFLACIILYRRLLLRNESFAKRKQEEIEHVLQIVRSEEQELESQSDFFAASRTLWGQVERFGQVYGAVFYLGLGLFAAAILVAVYSNV